LAAIISRKRKNVRMIRMFIWMARSLFNAQESMTTPYSVNASGAYLECRSRPGAKVTVCDLRADAFAIVNWNMNFLGEAPEITAHRLIENSCGHLIQDCQACTQHDFLATNNPNLAFDEVGRDVVFY
jgi:hypothetical protein